MRFHVHASRFDGKVSHQQSFLCSFFDACFKGSEKQYGYVLRSPDGSFLLFLSSLCLPNLFSSLLRHIAHNGDYDYVHVLIEEKLPKPGRSFQLRQGFSLKYVFIIFVFLVESVLLSFNSFLGFRRMPPLSRFFMGEVNCAPLLQSLSADLIAKLFFLILIERRVVLFGSNVPNVCACVHALASLMFPFSYDHLLFTILPASMADYLCAPFPYLVGVHASAIELVRKMPIDSVLFCNLDHKILSGLDQADLILLPPVQVNSLAGRLDRARDKGFGTIAWNQEVKKFERKLPKINFFFLKKRCKKHSCMHCAH